METLIELENLGLSAKEAQLYLAMLQSGKVNVGMLAKKSGLARPTVYFLLENLQARGLVSVESKRGKTSYVTHPPRALLTMLEKSRIQLDDKLEHLKTILPELATLFKPRVLPAPGVRSFEGKEAIASFLQQQEDLWHQSMLDHQGEWWGYESPTLYEHYKSWFTHIWKKFEPLRRSQLSVRLFCSTEVRTVLRKRYPRTELRPAPAGKEFASTIWIMGEYIVVLLSDRQPHYAFEIKDALLGDNLRTVFQLLWASSG